MNAGKHEDLRRGAHAGEQNLRFNGDIVAGAAPVIPLCNRSRPILASFAQTRLWFLQMLEPESTAYHALAAFRVKGPLEPGPLRRALAEIVHRHESLRTTFVERNSQVFQIIHAAGDLPLPLEDLRGVP